MNREDKQRLILTRPPDIGEAKHPDFGTFRPCDECRGGFFCCHHLHSAKIDLLPIARPITAVGDQSGVAYTRDERGASSKWRSAPVSTRTTSRLQHSVRTVSSASKLATAKSSRRVSWLVLKSAIKVSPSS